MSWEQAAQSAMASGEGGGGGGGGADYTRFIRNTQANRAGRTANRERADADYLKNLNAAEQAEAEALEARAPLDQATLEGLEAPGADTPVTYYARGVAPTAKSQNALLQNLQKAQGGAPPERRQLQPEDQVVSEAVAQARNQKLGNF